jgi:hypothetical protein
VARIPLTGLMASTEVGLDWLTRTLGRRSRRWRRAEVEEATGLASTRRNPPPSRLPSRGKRGRPREALQSGQQHLDAKRAWLESRAQAAAANPRAARISALPTSANGTIQARPMLHARLGYQHIGAEAKLGMQRDPIVAVL